MVEKSQQIDGNSEYLVEKLTEDVSTVEEGIAGLMPKLETIDIVTDVRMLMHPCTKADPMALGNVREVVDKLIDTDRKLTQIRKYAVAGLAANQVGYFLRIALITYGAERLVFVNPVLSMRGRTFVTSETCYSRPGKPPILANRYKSVKVTSDNRRFTGILVPTGYSLPTGVIKLHGTEAIVMQHEVDHLNGILI